MIHQRVGIPLAATFAVQGHAFTLTTGGYLFNDADDFDLPILLRYIVAFAGHQGPLAQMTVEGGFLDVTRAGGPAWMIRHSWTFFAYLP